MTARILTIVGARPQFIKSIFLSKEISKRKSLQEKVVNTGQHFDDDMSKIFFTELFDNSVQKNLNINNLPSSKMVARTIEAVSTEIEVYKPDLVLLFGDTNSTLAGAIAANKCGIKIAHVEGGVRNLDRKIPEEANRIVTDNLSDIIYYSTDDAMLNLQKEGFSDTAVRLIKTGDLMADAVRYAKLHCEDRIYDNDFILLTLHRNFNLYEVQLRSIMRNVNLLSEEIDVIFPIHPNTFQKIEEYKIELSQKIKLVEPQSYLKMMQLLHDCKFVITDSGGLQREAYIMKKKSLVVLDRTPWTELAQYKAVNLCNHANMIEEFENLKKLRSDFDQKPYGDGFAATQICDSLENFLLNG